MIITAGPIIHGGFVRAAEVRLLRFVFVENYREILKEATLPMCVTIGVVRCDLPNRQGEEPHTISAKTYPLSDDA